MEQSTHQQPVAQPAQPTGSKQPKGKNKKLFIILGVVVGVLLLGGGAFALMKLTKNPVVHTTPPVNKEHASQTGDDEFAKQYLQNCKDRSVSFTNSPVATSQMGYLIPMGQMSDGHVTPTDHVYLAPLNQNAADNTTDVVMPADGVITGIGAMPAEYIGDKNQTVAPEDHRVSIAHNCQYVSIFIHVHKLSDKVQAAVGTKLQPNENKQLSLELKAGEKIGTIGGSPVDWSLMNAKQTLKGFITPSLYKGESWKIHVIDPISVYKGTLKEELIAKSLRTSEPYGGKIDYDKKGYLIGNWFQEGTNGYQGANQERYYDGHLSFAPSHIDPTGTIVSMGNWQGKAAQFASKTGNPDPATVSSGVPAKYELIDISYSNPNGSPASAALVKGGKLVGTGTVKGTVLVQLSEDGATLKFEKFPGKSAPEVTGFTAAALTYTR